MFNGFDLSTISDAKYGSTQVNEIYYGSTKIWPNNSYASKYLTIESRINDNDICFKCTSDIYAKTISVSTDNGNTWTQKTASSGYPGTLLATLGAGEKLLIKGNNDTYTDFVDYYHSIILGPSYAYGNIMSLIYGDNFINKTTLNSSNTYAFHRLFYNYGSSYLLNVDNLILPATTLAPMCYSGMFYNCSSLVNAPALPATTLEQACYSGMFENCSSLVNAPALPATTLTYGCYEYMFDNCSSLVNAPALPATTLAEICYGYMFGGCSSLINAPILPATTLAYACYTNMFIGCTSLNYIKCLATDISATNCTSYWCYGVPVQGTFVKPSSMTDWTTGYNGIPDGWTVTNI